MICVGMTPSSSFRAPATSGFGNFGSSSFHAQPAASRGEFGASEMHLIILPLRISHLELHPALLDHLECLGPEQGAFGTSGTTNSAFGSIIRN